MVAPRESSSLATPSCPLLEAKQSDVLPTLFGLLGLMSSSASSRLTPPPPGMSIKRSIPEWCFSIVVWLVGIDMGLYE